MMRFALLLMLLPFPVLALEPLDDGALAGVSGGEGIAVNVEFLINADRAGSTITPLSCPDGSAHPNGAPDCRLALQFNDRPGTWLVLKNYYGLFSLNRVWLDSEQTPATASGYCDAACQARFPSGFDANNRPVVQLSYDHSALAANAAFYGDGEVFLNVDRISAEFGATGYLLNDVTGSALGLRVADGPGGANGPARLRFDGRMQMYGY